MKPIAKKSKFLVINVRQKKTTKNGNVLFRIVFTGILDGKVKSITVYDKTPMPLHKIG